MATGRFCLIRGRRLSPAGSRTRSPLPPPRSRCPTLAARDEEGAGGSTGSGAPRSLRHRRTAATNTHQQPKRRRREGTRGRLQRCNAGDQAARGRPTPTGEHPPPGCLRDAIVPRHRLLSHFFAYCCFVCRNPRRVTLPTTRRREVPGSKRLRELLGEAMGNAFDGLRSL